MPKLVSALVVLLAVGACGGGNKGPTSPSPTPTPTPTPVVPTLAFATTAPATFSGNAMALRGGGFRDGLDPGTIWIGVVVNGQDIVKVRGDLRWDSSVLTYDAWGKGDWFQQGDALVDWTFYSYKDHVSLFLDRPSSAAGAKGTGTVFWIRLKPVARTGSSPLQWNDPELFGKDYAARPLVGGVYGGTVTVQ